MLQTRQKPYRFVARIHAHSSSRQFYLDPKEFYKKWGKKVPRKHHELEILEPSTEVLRKQPLHVHRSKKSANLFVCYPLEIRTVESAIKIFRVWCGGTVLAWKRRIDLNTICATCHGDNEKVFDALRRGHQIAVGGAVVE